MRFVTTTLPFSTDLALDDAMSALLRKEIAWAEIELDECFKDWTQGPRLGPNRSDYNRIMAPVWARQRLRAHVLELMPGKTPGRFHRAHR